MPRCRACVAIFVSSKRMRRSAVRPCRDNRTFDISCHRSNRWAWSNLCVGPLHHHLPKALFTGSFTDVIGQAMLKAEAKEGLQRPFLNVCIEYGHNHLKLKLWTKVADIKDPLKCFLVKSTHPIARRTDLNQSSM